MTLAIIYAIFYILVGFLVVTVAFKIDPPVPQDRFILFLMGWVSWPAFLLVIIFVILKHLLTRYINFIVK